MIIIKEIFSTQCALVQHVCDEVLLTPFNYDGFLTRLDGQPHLALIAVDTAVDNAVIGFKIGYERGDGFYSWVGGVLPAYRRKGVATLLADVQEQWAKDSGYIRIWFKTYEVFKPMIKFALQRGFTIMETSWCESRNDIQYTLEKILR